MDKKACVNRKEWLRFVMEEDGVGVVEVVLIGCSYRIDYYL